MTTPDRLVRAAGVSPPTQIHRPPGIPDSARTIRAGHCRSGRCATRSSAAASAASRGAAGTSQGLKTPPLAMRTTTGSSTSGKPVRRRNHRGGRPSPLIDRLEAVGHALPPALLSRVIPAGLLSRQVRATLPRSEAVAAAPDVSCLVGMQPRHRPPKPWRPRPSLRQTRRLRRCAGQQRRPLLIGPGLPTAGRAASLIRPTPTPQAGWRHLTAQRRLTGAATARDQGGPTGRVTTCLAAHGQRRNGRPRPGRVATSPGPATGPGHTTPDPGTLARLGRRQHRHSRRGRRPASRTARRRAGPALGVQTRMQCGRPRLGWRRRPSSCVACIAGLLSAPGPRTPQTARPPLAVRWTSIRGGLSRRLRRGRRAQRFVLHLSANLSCLSTVQS